MRLNGALHCLQTFDELLLLKRGGRTIYLGPTGHESQELVQYCESYNSVDTIPEGANPASWMLDVSLYSTYKRSKPRLETTG